MKIIFNLKEKRNKLPLFIPMGTSGSFDKPILPKKIIWSKNHYLPYIQNFTTNSLQDLPESLDHFEL